MTTKAIEAGARAILDLPATVNGCKATILSETAWAVSKACIEAAIASGELVPASAVAAINRLAIARAICRSDHGPGVPSCMMDDHPEREPCNEKNCRRFEQVDAVIAALSPEPDQT